MVSWTISPATGGPFGTAALMNGKALPSAIADGEVIGEVPVVGVRTVGGELSLPPISVTFARVEGLVAPAGCAESGILHALCPQRKKSHTSLHQPERSCTTTWSAYGTSENSCT